MGERIPLTIADYDREKGYVTIIFQKVGKTTMLLDSLDDPVQVGLVEVGIRILRKVELIHEPASLVKFDAKPVDKAPGDEGID